jgi:hypothetical protein
MDYVEALLVLTTTIADMRQRIIALEAKVDNLDGDTPSHEDLVERIEALENYEWNDSWDDNVRDAVGCMTFSVTID